MQKERNLDSHLLLHIALRKEREEVKRLLRADNHWSLYLRSCNEIKMLLFPWDQMSHSFLLAYFFYYYFFPSFKTVILKWLLAEHGVWYYLLPYDIRKMQKLQWSWHGYFYPLCLWITELWLYHKFEEKIGCK